MSNWNFGKMENAMEWNGKAIRYSIERLLDRATPEQLDLVWRFLHALLT